MLIGLMLLAFLVLVIARTTPPSTSQGSTPSMAGGLVASSSPALESVAPSATTEPTSEPSTPPASASTSTAPASPTSLPSASVSAPASPPASAPASPEPTVAPSSLPTARPTSTPAPAGATRYTVKSGDTLYSIAALFNTTVKKLKAANGITGSTVIHPGQVLVIP
jgi:LysM repeat protein